MPVLHVQSVASVRYKIQRGGKQAKRRRCLPLFYDEKDSSFLVMEKRNLSILIV